MWEFSVQNIHASCNQMVIFSKGVPKVSTSGSSPIFFMKLEETYKQAPLHFGHSERVTDSLIVNACLEIPPPLPPTHTHTHTHTYFNDSYFSDKLQNHYPNNIRTYNFWIWKSTQQKWHWPFHKRKKGRLWNSARIYWGSYQPP